ncbi:hypothetical protein CC2G_002129 [Coprinopsis cinerea AmutBmut pab1-1]|nr:hypothetical protein CC2G_002129 [Coprinopsis cinerea AmutBmut pab1-1]
MSEIEKLASQGTAVNLVAAACLTALIYNHLLTMNQEVVQIWPNRFSLAKALFLSNRYIVEAVLLFNCISASRPFHSENLHILSSLARRTLSSLTISNIIVQGILLLVIWALYRENRVVLSIATFFYVGGAATLIGLTIHDYVGEEVLVDRTLRNLPGCYASSVPSIIAGFWIGPLIVESVLFVLVVSRAFFWWRHETRIPVLLAVLARDSTLYFAFVFALLLANYLVFQFGPPALSSLLVTPTITAGCILGSHMLLNVRAMNTLESEPPRHDIIDLTSWPRFNPTQTELCGSDTSHGQDYIGKHRYGP